MIVGQNTLLNQYVPTFYIKNLHEGQTLVYDAVRKAFINSDAGGSGGAERLGQLLDVSDNVDNPLSVQNGQALIYNSFTSLWENAFTDYNTLLNKPTSSSFSFAGLSDTAKPSLPDGYVKWNSTGTQLVYSTTIPAASITGLALVATTGDYNDLINKPTTLGTVTSVSATGLQGVSTSVVNGTTTPNITIGLGNITPTSVSSSGTISGSNLSGTNTGDQTITLTGDVSGTGTGTFATTLATVNSTTGTFGNSTTVPQFTVDAKGRITNVVNVPISTSGVGTVTSVSGTGTVSGLTLSGTVTTAGSLTLGGSLVLTNSDIVTGLGYVPYDASNPAGYTSNLGTVTSVAATGSADISVTGSPITSSGTFTFGLTDTTVTPDTYGSATTVPQFVVDSKGRITSVINIPISSGGSGTVTSVGATGNDGITVSGAPVTTSGVIVLGLGDITPTSVASTGPVTGSNLSGTNTGDQTIQLTGDVTGSGTGTFPTTLATVNATPGTYGDQSNISVVTVNNKGLVTSVTTTPVDTTVSDILPADGSTTETFTIATRHQYIVTGRLEIVGHVINNGRIAVL